ncbi:MAG: SDR family oxidoreductase [Acidimicrobiales bacterium]
MTGSPPDPADQIRSHSIGTELDLEGRTAVVTGASDGIGAVTASRLAGRGATVITVGRNPTKLETVADRIRSEGGAVEPHAVDFGSLDAVRELAGAILAAHDRVDVLVNNAGLTMEKRTLSADGFEMTFAVNHLAPFLLTNLLAPALVAAAPARVVTTSSVTMLKARIDFDDLQSERGYGRMKAYGMSKLCNVLFTRELARRFDPAQLTANCLHPGSVRTQIMRGRGLLSQVATGIGGLVLVSPEKGAETILFLAADPSVAATTGEYFVRNRSRPMPAAALNEESTRRLWEVSASLVGLPPAGGP